MRVNIIIVVTLIALIAIFLSIGITNRDVPGRTKDLVNDYAGVLDSETKVYLESRLKSFRDNSAVHTEIVITIIKSLKGKTIDTFTDQYASKWWRLPFMENHNRIQIVIVSGSGQMRIGVGKAMDKVVTGPITQDIINKVMLPSFSRNDYSGGMRAGVEEMIKILEKS